MRKVPLAPDVKADIIARGTPGFSGADLANLVNEAALFAARKNKRLVDMDDFEMAKDKVIMGAERRSLVMPEEERRNTAYHESGHAVVAKLLPKTDPVHKVTIIPRGRALGVTMQLPTEDRYSQDRERLLNTITVLFGGRIAEELFMDQMTTGASNDFERATEIARRMVTQWGMSDTLGPMVYGENEGEVFLGRSITTHKNVSETTLQKVDAEIRRIIDEQYKLARRLLEENRDKVETMAQGAARVGDAGRRPAERHHGRQAAALAQAAGGAHAERADGRRAGAAPGSTASRRAGGGRARSFRLAGVLRCGRFAPAAGPPAADGRGERHARFLFRRRQVSRPEGGDRAWPPADRGGRRHSRYRRRVLTAWCPGRCGAGGTGSRRPGIESAERCTGVRRHAAAIRDARGARGRRVHDQRHRSAAARPARSTRWPRPIAPCA